MSVFFPTATRTRNWIVDDLLRRKKTCPGRKPGRPQPPPPPPTVCSTRCLITSMRDTIVGASINCRHKKNRHHRQSDRRLPSPVPCGPEVQWDCSGPVSRFIFTHSGTASRARNLGTALDDTNLQVKMSLRKCHTFVPATFVPSNRTPVIILLHRNSSHRSIRHLSKHRSKKCPWYPDIVADS